MLGTASAVCFRYLGIWLKVRSTRSLRRQEVKGGIVKYLSAVALMLLLSIVSASASENPFAPIPFTSETGWGSWIAPPAREAGASIQLQNGSFIVKAPEKKQGDAALQITWPLNVEADRSYKLKFSADADKAGKLVIVYVLSVKPWTRYASVSVDVEPGNKEYECAIEVKKDVDGKYDAPRSLRLLLGEFEGAAVTISNLSGTFAAASEAKETKLNVVLAGNPFAPITFAPEFGWTSWIAASANSAGASIRQQNDSLVVRSPVQRQAEVNVQAIWPLSVDADKSYRLKFNAVTDKAGKLVIAYVLSVKPWTQYTSVSVDVVPDKKEYECVINVKKDASGAYENPRSLRFYFGGFEGATITLSSMFGTFFPSTEGKMLPAAIFTDNMVLQREIALPVWGNGRPDTEISVAFAGQTKTTITDKQGVWRVTLDPLKAQNDPTEMVITSGDEKVTVKNILVGEVWFCSGQSNMDMTLGGIKLENEKETPNVKEIQTANYSSIRQFEVSKNVSPYKKISTFRGTWEVCSPHSVENFTAVGYFFAKELYGRLGIPVGLIKCAYGGSPVEAWMSPELLQSSAYGKNKIATWEKKQLEYDPAKVKAEYDAAMNRWKEAVAAGRPAPQKPWRLDPEPVRDFCYPGTLYNAMLSPLVPYAIRGVIWYQGEGNTGGMKSYYETFPALIGEWRKMWGQGDFPFYYVQLANFTAPEQQPGENGWSLVRDAQLKTLSLPNTGMAVTIDIGEEKDIHPHNKTEVGRRLALWALSKDYQQSINVYSGPLFKSADFHDEQAIITFDHVGSGLATGKRTNVWDTPEFTASNPERFQICGADRKWMWAEARITGKDTVAVSAAGCAKPVAVRYAWMINPGVAQLLYNKEGLPASPFRTDEY